MPPAEFRLLSDHNEPPLLQVNGLIVPRRVELCTPHLVHALVFGSAEAHGRPEPDVEVAKLLESSYQFFGVELGPFRFNAAINTLAAT